MSLKKLTLERLNGSFLTHSELQLYGTQHPVTVEGKHFMTFIAFWDRMHSTSSMIISNTLAELQQEIPRKPEWVIFDPCRTITRNKLMQIRRLHSFLPVVLHNDTSIRVTTIQKCIYLLIYLLMTSSCRQRRVLIHIALKPR